MIEVTRRRLDVTKVVDSVRRDDAGAIVLFLGSVRGEKAIRALDYEVYAPMATKVFLGLVEQAKTRFHVLDLSIAHRVGRVPVGGDSVAIACAATVVKRNETTMTTMRMAIVVTRPNMVGSDDGLS